MLVPLLIAAVYVFRHHGLVSLAFATAAVVASALGWGLNERVRTEIHAARRRAGDSDRRFEAASRPGRTGCRS